MPTTPRNTDTDAQNNPLGQLLDMMSEKTPGDAIYAQEAAGQQSLVNSDTLPSRMSSDDRKVLEQAGVIFGDPVPGDDMFIYVTLPEGWTKLGTSHSMHSELLDKKGRKRAGIFYKAAFYDRRADLNVVRRFGTGMDYDLTDKGVVVMFVTDSGSKVFMTKEYTFIGEKYRDDYNTQSNAAGDEVKAWLEEHYPNWEDASAYWD
jgi:hypothetical protein